MAIFHLSAKAPIARSQGRSATAAAAYRAGAAIRDARTGRLHDYSRRRGVMDTRLVLPGGRLEQDRAAFWNGIESHHRRKDAVLAREVIVALPSELTEIERAELAFRFARGIADEFQVAVDCAIHTPSARGDDRNFHAHLLLTACTVDAEGALGPKAARLDPISCKRAREPDSISWLRPGWERLQNLALEKASSPQRVDHRSNRVRGIHRVPTVHVGVRSKAAARRDAFNLELRSRNGQLEKLNRQIDELEATRRSLASRREAARGSEFHSKEQIRHRVGMLLTLILEMEAQYSALQASRCFDRFQVRQIIAGYHEELRLLNTKLGLSVQAPRKALQGRKRL